MNAVVGEQRSGLDVSDGMGQLTSSMRVMFLHGYQVCDGRANEGLQVGHVVVVLMMMADKLVSMIGHGDCVGPMLGVMNVDSMRHDFRSRQGLRIRPLPRQERRAWVVAAGRPLLAENRLLQLLHLLKPSPGLA
jgi:hypothetical protein